MIEKKKPELEVKSLETVEIMKKVEEETIEAEKQKVIVQKDEYETSKKAKAASDI